MAITYTKTLDLKPLDQFKKDLKKAEKAELRVGVFGGTHPDGEAMGQVAYDLEFGTIYSGKPTPPRSFLRAPLTLELKGQLPKETLPYDPTKEFSISKVLGMIGDTSVYLIHACFDSEGFGKWAPNGKKWSKVKAAAGAPKEPGFFTRTLYNSIKYIIKL